MRLHISILAFSFLLFLSAKGQSSENIKQLQGKILSADSIVLISHVLTAEYAPKIVRDWDKTDGKSGKTKTLIKKIPNPKFLKNEKINPTIIKQRKTISKAEITELSQIFKYEIVAETNQIKCNQPHHSILNYKKNILSYIDICFDCKHINTSKDIALTEADFNDNKWERLKNFFKKNGLTYQLLLSNY